MTAAQAQVVMLQRVRWQGETVTRAELCAHLRRMGFAADLAKRTARMLEVDTESVTPSAASPLLVT